VLGVAGLLVTLVFNTIGVWRAEEQARRSRIATEVNLLTQVGDGANQAAQAVVASGANDKRCDAAAGLSLSDAQEAKLLSALTYYDYMAWLFNDEHVTLPSAKRYWGRDMWDAYDLGRTFKGEEIDAAFQDLSRFVHAAPEELKPPDYCQTAGASP
jgi:hypothetical protein